MLVNTARCPPPVSGAALPSCTGLVDSSKSTCSVGLLAPFGNFSGSLLGREILSWPCWFQHSVVVKEQALGLGV